MDNDKTVKIVTINIIVVVILLLMNDGSECYVAAIFTMLSGGSSGKLSCSP